MLKKIGAALALVASLTLPTASFAQAAGPGCQFVLGFATLANTIPQQVGQCADSESHNIANGDALQHTNTGGLMVWRKGDNWTAFTDGYHTWINGPTGLQERLNTDRFPWEAPTPTPTPAAAPAPTPAAAAPVSPGSPLTAEQVASIVVPAGYPALSELPASSQVGCLHMAQDLVQAGLHKISAQKDDALCPYQDDGTWPGFKQTA